jgi:hypothetical protein
MASGTHSSITPGLAKISPHSLKGSSAHGVNMNLQGTANDTMTEASAFSTKAVTTKKTDADLDSERGLQDVDTGGVLPFSISLIKDITQESAGSMAAVTTTLGLITAATAGVISEEKTAIELSGSAVTKKAGPCTVAVILPVSKGRLHLL